MDAPYVLQNDLEFERLRSLLERLSPEDYSRDIGFGWTVGTALAHLAYWDEFAVLVHARWQRQGFVPISTGESDLVNDAALPLFRGLPWNTVKREVIRAAEDADRAAAAVSSSLAEQIKVGGRERLLYRYVHRHMHLDDIERSLIRP